MSVLTNPAVLSGCGIFLQSKSCRKNNKENLEGMGCVKIFIYKGVGDAIGKGRGRYLRARQRTNTTKRNAKFKNSRIAP
jgi:hypothetical protein